MTIIIVAILTLIISLGVWAVVIEPGMLVCDEVSFDIPKHTPKKGRIIRVVQFTDVHLGFFYSKRRLDKLVRKIQAANPDIIVCTGDLLNHSKISGQKNMAVNALGRLSADMGKFAVWGNHDRKGGTDLYAEIMNDAKFTLLKNSCAIIRSKNGDTVAVAGLDEAFYGMPDSSMLLGDDVSSADIRLVLVHQPDTADTIKENTADVILAGHSHGGQVRMPIIGATYKPRLAQKYVMGKYTVNGMHLYVNTGAGYTGLPVRFLCPAKISVMDIHI